MGSHRKLKIARSVFGGEEPRPISLPHLKLTNGVTENILAGLPGKTMLVRAMRQSVGTLTEREMFLRNLKATSSENMASVMNVSVEEVRGREGYRAGMTGEN
jgi:hypothetical protein